MKRYFCFCFQFITVMAITLYAEKGAPSPKSRENPLSTTIQPGEGQEKFLQWAPEAIKNLKPRDRERFISRAQRLYQSQKLLTLPSVLFLENHFPDINSTLLQKSQDTAKIFLGTLKPNDTLYNKFVISIAPNKVWLTVFDTFYVNENLTTLSKALVKAKKIMGPNLKKPLNFYRIHAFRNQSNITVYFLPIMPSNRILVGGGAQTNFNLTLDSLIDSSQIHNDLRAFPVDTSRGFHYQIPSTQNQWTEIDFAQYLRIQEKLKPNQITRKDYDSTSVKYIQAQFQELQKSIKNLKKITGVQKEIHAHINRISKRKEDLLRQIETAGNIFAQNFRTKLYSKSAYWKIKSDTLKVQLNNIQQLMEESLKSISHQKILSELDLFLNVWNSQEPQKYSFVLKRKCFCSATFAGPFVVEMQDTKVKKIKAMKGSGDTHSQRMNSAGAKNKFSIITHFGSYSLNGMMREIKSFIQQNQPHSVVIDYNETFGYPNKIKFDPNIFTKGDELTITIGALNIPEEYRGKKAIDKPKNKPSVQTRPF